MGAAAKAAFRVFSSRDGRFMSAAIAFYALLSAVPLAYLVLFVATRFVSEASARAALEAELGRWTGLRLAGAVARWADEARSGAALGAVAVVVLLYSATRLFAALERGINAMWELEPAEDDRRTLVARIRRQARTRGLAFAVVALLGLVLALVVAFRAAVAAGERAGARLVEVSGALSWLGTIAVATIVFFLLYAALPRERARPRETFVGAVVSALFFLAGTHAVTTYVAHKEELGLGETLLVLLWLRYAAQVFLLGAAVVGVYLRARGALPLREEASSRARIFD